jgi:hypothetical protein
MLIKLYYDLETCGIIIVRLFQLLFFCQITTHQGHFIVLGHYIKNIHPGKKHNRAIITMTSRMSTFPCTMYYTTQRVPRWENGIQIKILQN